MFWLFMVYTVFGVLILLTMGGALEGIRRALSHMIRLEKELHLEVTTKVRVAGYFVPYFAMTVVILIFCCVMAFRFR